MKILHIGKYYPPYSGGIEHFMADLLPQLSSSKIKIWALVHDHVVRIKAKIETINSIKIIRVPSYGRLLYAPMSPTFPYYLSQVLSQFQPDIIHIHLPNTSAFWLLLSIQAKKIPWVIHWHSDVIGSAPNQLVAVAYHLYQPFERALLRHSQQIIATSPHYLESSVVLKKWAMKTKVIPLGLPPLTLQISDIAQQQAEQCWGDCQYRLLTIGRLTYYKGHQYLIEALQGLKDTQLIIIGQGEERKKLQAQIDQLNLNHSISLIGQVDRIQLHALLNSCDVFCLPSIERTEAFGLVLLEAMQYKKPLIVSHLSDSGMTWVCQDQQNGIVAEPANSQDLHNKIEQLLVDKNQCQQLGEKGYQRLKHQFTIKSVAQKIQWIYQQLMI
jgi:rhamnosyl/mannosyltransferase